VQSILLHGSETWPAHTHTHNHFTAIWILSGTTWVSRYQKKHSSLITPIAVINHPLSASFLFNPHTRQSFFHNISPCFLWSSGLPLGLEPSTSYSMYFFTQSLSSFCNTCPYHLNLFRRSTEIMSSNPSLSLNPLLGILSCSFTPHIHLTILISAH